MFIGDRTGFDPINASTSGEVKVGWGEARTASNEAMLTTEGLATCIGIAIYDPNSSTGYLAHVFAGLDNHFETAVPMVHEAAARASDITQLSAWVRGGTLTPGYEYDVELILRAQTVKLLGSVGIKGKRVDVIWNEIPSLAVHMSLACENGEMTSNYPIQLFGNREKPLSTYLQREKVTPNIVTSIC